jgi:DNA-binding PadR family transcriptional regulator
MNGQHGENHANDQSHSPLTTSLLEPALLLLVRQKARHGYTLLNELDQQKMGSIHPSMVYRMLRDLEGFGWIRSTWDMDETQGPPRRNYEITTLGIQALENWQKQLEQHKNLIEQLLSRFNS